MRRVLLFLLLLAASPSFFGCSYYVVSSRIETKPVASRVLDSKITFGVDGVTLADETLTIALNRTCEEVLEVDTEKLDIQQRKYDTLFAWVGIGTVAAIMGSVVMVMFADADPSFCSMGGPCTLAEEQEYQDNQDAATNMAIGSAIGVGVLSAITLYFELTETETETVVERLTETKYENNKCQDDWPRGEGKLMASVIGKEYAAESLGNGRVEVKMKGAPADLWNTTTALDLQLPNTQDWVPVMLPENVRKAGIALSGEPLRVDRAYVRYDSTTKDYQNLLEAGATRMQSTLTSTRRYQFVSDDTTRTRIEELVEKGGGSPEDRRKKAVEAARQENISWVFNLSIKPVYESQVLLVLTVHDTVSGDQVFTKDAQADLTDAFKALDGFDGLGMAYLEWVNK
ncbi:MAG: hypothetical protein AUK47_05570 [Deltaproteobacteria bacterium CG2_30_63_29]|nr:MAG: hypothetical protein AUK47_05570 [Deltaproteobacteria bacterium CG2_30_63_29]PJB39491.1 MAG: hypothetical protein CO108_17235 [Deltaproteobacteria bacterium CG_4_9_14_3_um_filter_63_12]